MTTLEEELRQAAVDAEMTEREHRAAGAPIAASVYRDRAAHLRARADLVGAVVANEHSLPEFLLAIRALCGPLTEKE